MRIIILVFFSFFLLANIVFADECNTTLKDSDSYQELSVILNCMARKIENLEKIVNNSQPVDADQKKKQSDQPLLDNKYFTIYNLKASRDDAKQKIHISFSIKSKFDQDILLAYLWSSATLTNELGKSVVTNSYNGISYCGRGELRQTGYTVINSGGFLTVGFIFDDPKGKDFAFSFGIAQLIGEKQILYSIGKSNLGINE